MGDVTILGECSESFGPAREAFESLFSAYGDVGASFAVVVDGETVLDLWGGWCDAARARPWTHETIVNLYSTTKGITALAAAILVDRGLLDVDKPVIAYWPEFGAAGKAEIPVRWLLSHQAGLPVVDGEIAPRGVLKWSTMIGLLERQAPSWEPGTKMGYHAITYGWLVGEVIRRITAKAPGAFIRDEIAEPLGVDFFVGTPASEDHRIADMLMPGGNLAATLATDGGSLAARALGIGSPPGGAHVNSREWRAAELLAANGHGNAPALARIYGALARGGEVDGVRLVQPSTIEAFTTEQASGRDEVIGIEARRGLGFILNSPGGRYHWGPNPCTFGHSGAGGSLGFADPDTRLGFGYAMNQMMSGLSADPRWHVMIDAVYDCL